MGIDNRGKIPEILAPAGDKDCFLAALGAGADAVYLGLKHFSARMEAENFSLGELARLVELAHSLERRVYVAMNIMLKPGEIYAAYRLAKRLAEQVRVDGLIVQDLAMLDIARQTGFVGSIALSTLANVSSPLALLEAKRLGANRVILPRELSIDEMKSMGGACPSGLELECFVHGALCYCVSGRCYWSSYMGGKSGLRGRCVQPCRRIYYKARKDIDKETGARYFACQDLRLAEVAKALLTVPNLVSWKIEGRKKGPHYVYHAVMAYRIIRDNAEDGKMRRMGEEILDFALGRPGVKGRFLPQRQFAPMAPDRQTSSGLLVGHVKIVQAGKCQLKPRHELKAGDLLRVGVEDEKWHSTLPVTRDIPKNGSLILHLPKHKTPKTGVAVYLIDRREPELKKIIARLNSDLEKFPPKTITPVNSEPQLPAKAAPARLPDMLVRFNPVSGVKNRNLSAFLSGKFMPAFWLNSKSLDLPATQIKRSAFWLPPDIWPENEAGLFETVKRAMRQGANIFVCNTPWQRALFPDQNVSSLTLIAGPFCNIANALALLELKKAGFRASFISPELTEADYLELPKQSPLPLGLIIGGCWPVGVSRFGRIGLNANEPFTSPKGEVFWSRDYGGSTWIYPAWPLDLSAQKRRLVDAGYSFFAYLDEISPKSIPEKERPGLFNWAGTLL